MEGGSRYVKALYNIGKVTTELHELGVQLKDYSRGLVDFPSRRAGRGSAVLAARRAGRDRMVARSRSRIRWASTVITSGPHPQVKGFLVNAECGVRNAELQSFRREFIIPLSAFRISEDPTSLRRVVLICG